MLIRSTRLRRLLALSREERTLFLEAVLQLPVMAASLRLLGLGRTQALLVRLAGRRQPLDVRPGDGAVRVRARAVASAACHGPFRSNCLQQSLLLWWLLRRVGIASELRIGVRTRGGRLEAHAWVEAQGQVLIDGVDVRERFAPFERAITPRMAGRR